MEGNNNVQNRNVLRRAGGEMRSAITVYVVSRVLAKLVTYLVFAPLLFIFVVLARGLRKLIGFSESTYSGSVDSNGPWLRQEEERSVNDAQMVRKYAEAYEAWKRDKRSAGGREKSCNTRGNR